MTLPGTERTDAVLLVAARDGDATAWHDLVERYSQFMYANARAIGANHGLAEDVVQMVWMKLLDHVDRIEKPSSIRGWLAIATRNTARTELTRSGRTSSLNPHVQLVDPEPGPQAVVDQQSELVALGKCMNGLSDACQQLLRMRFSAEMSLREISETLDMPMGSIGPTQGRCLKKLDECLALSA